MSGGQTLTNYRQNFGYSGTGNAPQSDKCFAREEAC